MAKRRRSVTITAAWIIGALTIVGIILAALLSAYFDKENGGDEGEDENIVINEPQFNFGEADTAIKSKKIEESIVEDNSNDSPFNNRTLSSIIQVSDTNYVWIKNHYTGHQDSGQQFKFYGCPNGRFFATIKIKDNETLDEAINCINHDVWLGPMDIILSVNTNILPDEYIRITDIVVEILDYNPEPKDPQLLFYNTVCSDANPGYGEIGIDVNLKGARIPISFLKRIYKENEYPSLIIWQKNPTTIRFNVTASQPGWYKYEIFIKYIYKNVERTAKYSDPIKMFFPYERHYSWNYSNYGDGKYQTVFPLNEDEAKRFEQELNFPYPPAPDTIRNAIIPNNNI